MRRLSLLPLPVLVPQPALAFERLTDGQRFAQLVDGRDRNRLGIRLRLDPEDGTVSGRGMGYDVTGDWRREKGFFCRTLDWGSSDLGDNCQEVLTDGNRMWLVANRGACQSAGFRLR